MAGDPSEEMLSALIERDRVRQYLTKLDSLHGEGSITGEQYETARAEYGQRVEVASNRVEELRAQVQEQLDAVSGELEAHRSELGKLEARFKVQEIPLSRLQSDGVPHRRAIRVLQEQERQLLSLVEAESAEGLAAPVAAPFEEKAPQRAAAAATSPARPAPAYEQPAYREPTYEMPQEREGVAPRTPLRIVSLAAGALLLVSVFLAWVAPTELLGTDSEADPGVVVTFLAGLAGLVGGLAAVGFAFIPRRRIRGVLYLLTGAAALAALVAAVLLEEIPLLNSYFRELAVMREGFYVYIAAAGALAVLGIIQTRRA